VREGEAHREVEGIGEELSLYWNRISVIHVIYGFIKYDALQSGNSFLNYTIV